jgi:hypothetical protein
VLPLVIVVVAGESYLSGGIPSAGNDLWLVLLLGAAGAALGAGNALATKVWRRPDGTTMAKAGFVAAGLWILGVGARVGFSLASSHGGGPAITRFSIAHDITSSQAWVAALVVMALADVVFRVAILGVRWRRLGGAGTVAAGEVVVAS